MKKSKHCRKKCKNTNFEKQSILYSKLVVHVLRFKMPGNFDVFVNKYTLYGFAYDQNTHKNFPNSEK